MAIKKKVKTKYGIDAEYWSLTAVTMSGEVDKGKIDCVYSGWVSAEAKAAGAAPIDKTYFTMLENLKINLIMLEQEIINHVDCNGLQFFEDGEQVAEV
jgi:hypothetical protein